MTSTDPLPEILDDVLRPAGAEHRRAILKAATKAHRDGRTLHVERRITALRAGRSHLFSRDAILRLIARRAAESP